MPAVFVHGNPDTHRLWDTLRGKLSRRDTMAVSLPGFRCGVPEDFGATKEDYADWLIGELEGMGEPVDLVGHDWGSLLAQRVASLRPELVRTLACGGAAVDAEYEWHDMAKMWQTPGVGEQVMQAFGGEAMKQALVGQGVPKSYADVVVSNINEVMKDCVLKLYRSAVNVGAEWQADLEKVRKPALVIWGTDDPYVPVRFGERLAERFGAELVRLENCGHWWPVQREEGAVEEACLDGVELGAL
jgi:pimeloyl-ACP methyl ester carboxylesterase